MKYLKQYIDWSRTNPTFTCLTWGAVLVCILFTMVSYKAEERLQKKLAMFESMDTAIQSVYPSLWTVSSPQTAEMKVRGDGSEGIATVHLNTGFAKGFRFNQYFRNDPRSDDPTKFQMAAYKDIVLTNRKGEQIVFLRAEKKFMTALDYARQETGEDYLRVRLEQDPAGAGVAVIGITLGPNEGEIPLPSRRKDKGFTET